MDIQSSPPVVPPPARPRIANGLIAGGLIAVIVIGILSLLILFRSEPTSGRGREDYIEMQVYTVVKDTSEGGATLVLQDRESTVLLAMGIGSAEAAAIEYEVYGKKPPRPLTADLFKNLMESMELKLMEVEISHVSNSTYFAKLFILKGRHVIELDARPSDAVALALRFDCSIYVHKTVLEQYGLDSQTRKRSQTKKKLISEFFENSYVIPQ